MMSARSVRPPAVAGTFYPGTRQLLHADVEALLRETAPSSEAGVLLGLIVPHAGYLYSGPTAAKAFALLRGRAIDTCILVGPSHQEYFRGVSVYPGAAYATPLGEAAIDIGLRDDLLGATPVVHASVEGHRGEHALEVQLPFLQTVLPDVKILPVVIGDQSAENCYALGEALACAARNRRVALIASSDLSHFHSSAVAREKDSSVLAFIEAYRVGELMESLEDGSCEACGGGPIVAVMTAAQRLGANCASIIHACNSGDITGGTDRVVGYCSAAIWKTM